MASGTDAEGEFDPAAAQTLYWRRVPVLVKRPDRDDRVESLTFRVLSGHARRGRNVRVSQADRLIATRQEWALMLNSTLHPRTRRTAHAAGTRAHFSGRRAGVGGADRGSCHARAPAQHTPN